MTPLREQLLTDMKAKNLPKTVQERYILEVATLAQRTRKSPDFVAPDELTEFLERRSKELSAKEFAVAAEGLKFFFTETLGQVWRPKETKKFSPLRQRMIEDMRLRNLAPKTQQEYLRWSIKFSEFYAKSPAELSQKTSATGSSIWLRKSTNPPALIRLLRQLCGSCTSKLLAGPGCSAISRCPSGKRDCRMS